MSSELKSIIQKNIKVAKTQRLESESLLKLLDFFVQHALADNRIVLHQLELTLPLFGAVTLVATGNVGDMTGGG